MHDLASLLIFSSPSFPRCRKDDEELANHETMHGYLLARYIGEGLRARGFGDVEFIGEDWGWYCAVPNEGFSLMYGVCNEEDSGFQIQFSPCKPFIRRWFTKIPVEDKVRALQQAVFEILAAEPTRTDRPRWEK